MSVKENQQCFQSKNGLAMTYVAQSMILPSEFTDIIRDYERCAKERKIIER